MSYKLKNPELQKLLITPNSIRKSAGEELGQWYVLWAPRVLRSPSILAGAALNGLLSLILAIAFATFSVVVTKASIVGVAVGAFLLLGWLTASAVFSRLKRPVLRLLHEVDRFNTVIKALDIKDQLGWAGNEVTTAEERKNMGEALRLARTDLLNSLTTSRILKENQGFIRENRELMSDDLGALEALRVRVHGTRYAELLNEALQAAADVREEVLRLSK